jgi:16S rRNA (uracil1498-N3)-methyltransferase
MRLTRVYVQASLEPGASFELPADTGAHVARVLRARAGDALILFDGSGREFDGEVESVRGTRVGVAVGPARSVDRESPLAVTLVQCVPRGDRMDFIVQKATELGVARIVPVLSQRGVVRLDARQAESKAAHWRGVVASACEQCGRNRLPSVDEPRPLLDFLGSSDTAASAAAPDGAVSRCLPARLLFEPDSEARNSDWRIAGSVEIAIGPEGGFSPEEIDAFGLVGFERIGLGPRVLRTETAAIAAIAWLQARFGDMR